ncbi:RidA family protein [Dactylosporangium sp. NPDC050688]|uniref:RidA family protein n=1 Tax=Dactylosporangium sp. NPDC050688 TaxID=3157217 RepID=UPI003407C829
MNDEIAARLAALSLHLPVQRPPRFAYLPSTRHGNVAYFSGKTTIVDGQVRHPGRLGAEVSLADGQAAARIATLNLLAAVEADVGLEHVAQILKVTGFVASADGFVDQPTVIDAASQLLIDVLGAPGRHARSAVGVAWLPGNTPVEIEAVVALRPDFAQPEERAE